MARNKPEPESPADTQTAEENDAEDPRSWEHEQAEAVRAGELSAAQMEGGHGNVDPDNPDAQYPPGVVDNSAATLNATDDPGSFVPERKNQGEANRSGIRFENTATSPDYGTSSEQ